MPAQKTGGKAAKAARRVVKQPKAEQPKNYCFGCGQDNSAGLRLKMQLDAAAAVSRGTFRTSGRYRGSRAHLHGGIIATLLDEAMGKLNRLEEIIAPTAEMTIEYLRPVPIGSKVMLEGRRLRQEGRNFWREATVCDAQGNVLARARARFVKIADRSPTHP